MKKITALVLAIVMVISLTACGSLSVDSAKVILAGKTFKLPIKCSDLLKSGWSISADEAEQLSEYKFKAETWTIAYITMEDGKGNSFDIEEIYNPATEEKLFEDCLVTDLRLYANRVSDPDQFIIPGGLTLSSNYDDIVNTYGEPHESELFGSSSGGVYPNADNLTYTHQVTSKLHFYFHLTEDDQRAITSVIIDAEEAYLAQEEK